MMTAFVRPEKDAAGATYYSTWFDLYRIEGGKIAEHWDPMVKSRRAGRSQHQDDPAVMRAFGGIVTARWPPPALVLEPGWRKPKRLPIRAGHRRDDPGARSQGLAQLARARSTAGAIQPAPPDRPRSTSTQLRLVWARPLDAGHQEGTPLVHNGVLYFPGPSDAITGDRRRLGRRAVATPRELPKDIGAVPARSPIPTATWRSTAT